MRNNVASWLVFIGVTQFILLLIVAEALYPGYSISNNYISDLGVGKTALIFNTSISILGITLIIAGIVYTTKLPFRVTLTLTGLGALGVGLFPETTGDPHLLSALVTFLFSGISSYTALPTIKTPLKYFFPILGTMGLLSLFLFITHNYAGIGEGGIERMIVYPNLIWALGYSSSKLSEVEVK
ncbi:DUF998 domain-containing protein [Acidianus sp. RZ1]|uniref:DUF998 domain-containing protein n=1 Tax=Acidianus sp. RZ1 TaxID=1540082 RepID=UPI001490929F|nr:DUF998 domain-containing protein [Acidianus sp. RZ1]NON62768.1 DUF998 domain-containing protein [Acidianus sp. RZ1]